MADLVKKCTLCPLHESSKCNCLGGEGSAVASGLMAVGEAPARVEEEYNRIFAGPTGELLGRLLEKVGLRRADVYLTNAIKCRFKVAATKKPLEACRPYLVDEIRAVKPKVCVLMGETACRSVLKRGEISEIRGYPMFSEEFPGVIFLPTYHPAFVFQTKKNKFAVRGIIIRDLQKALSLARDPSLALSEPDSARVYQIARTVGEVDGILDYLSKGKEFVSVDSEANSEDPSFAKVLCLSLSNQAQTAFVIPFFGQHYTPLWSEEDRSRVVERVKRFLESDVPKIGQNIILYDSSVFERDLGIRIQNIVVDTLLLHHLVDENMPHGLEYLAGAYTRLPEYKDAVRKAIPKDAGYDYCPNHILWTYAAMDADATFRVAKTLISKAEEEGLMDLYRGETLPLAWEIRRLRERGVCYDREQAKKVWELYTGKIQALSEELYKMMGARINLGSAKQVREFLFGKLGLPSIEKTPGQQDSVNKGVLKELAKKHPVPGKILEISKLTHDVNNYLKPGAGVDKFVHPDGRLRPSWNMDGTHTGRLSCSKPALHNIKKDGEIRGILSAQPGWCWVHADYSTLEIRIVALLAGEERLLKAMAEGLDVHRVLAAAVFGKNVEEVTPEERGKAKGIISFSTIYGQMAETLAETLGISVEEAAALRGKVFALIPRVVQWIEEQKKEVLSLGYAKNVFDRRRHLYGILELTDKHIFSCRSKYARESMAMEREEIFRQAVNHKVQSVGHDLLSRATVSIGKRLREEGMEARLIFTHHDALAEEAPPSEVPMVIRIIKEEMERPVPEFKNYSFPVDVTVGERWGDEKLTEKFVR